MLHGATAAERGGALCCGRVRCQLFNSTPCPPPMERETQTARALSPTDDEDTTVEATTTHCARYLVVLLAVYVPPTELFRRGYYCRAHIACCYFRASVRREYGYWVVPIPVTGTCSSLLCSGIVRVRQDTIYPTVLYVYGSAHTYEIRGSASK